MSTKMQVQIENICPNTARTYMLANTSNRIISEHVVRRYRTEMAENKWVVNGESIVFDTNGRLVNGQHRLKACIDSGMTLHNMVVVRGVPVEAFATFDSGKKRSGCDILGMAGEKNVAVLSAATRAYQHTVACSPHQNLSNSTQLYTLEKHPLLRTFTNAYVSSPRRPLPSYFVGVCTLMAELHGEELAMNFMLRTLDGVLVQKGDPEYTLRERFTLGRNMDLNRTFGLEICIKAANARILGKKCSRLVMLPEESFPVMVGLGGLL